MKYYVTRHMGPEYIPEHVMVGSPSEIIPVFKSIRRYGDRHGLVKCPCVYQTAPENTGNGRMALVFEPFKCTIIMRDSTVEKYINTGHCVKEV